MKKVFYLLLLIIGNFPLPVIAMKNASFDSVIVFEIKNSNLIPVLDSMILLEKKCEYYNSKLVFNIKIYPNKGYSNIQIEAIRYKPGGRLYLGCFQYSGHLFLVSGQFEESLFVKTNKKKPIEIHKEKKRSDHILIEDDTFSSCLYKYLDNQFYLIGRLSYCK